MAGARMAKFAARSTFNSHLMSRNRKSGSWYGFRKPFKLPIRKVLIQRGVGFES